MHPERWHRTLFDDLLWSQPTKQSGWRKVGKGENEQSTCIHMICIWWYGCNSFPYNKALIRKWTHQRALSLECHWSIEEFLFKTSDICWCCQSAFLTPLRPRWKYPNRLIPFWKTLEPMLPPIILHQETSQQRESGIIFLKGKETSPKRHGWSDDLTCGIVRYIDNACMQVIQKPSFFDVVATGTEPGSCFLKGGAGFHFAMERCAVDTPIWNDPWDLFLTFYKTLEIRFNIFIQFSRYFLVYIPFLCNPKRGGYRSWHVSGVAIVAIVVAGTCLVTFCRTLPVCYLDRWDSCAFGEGCDGEMGMVGKIGRMHLFVCINDGMMCIYVQNIVGYWDLLGFMFVWG